MTHWRHASTVVLGIDERMLKARRELRHIFTGICTNVINRTVFNAIEPGKCDHALFFWGRHATVDVSIVQHVFTGYSNSLIART